MKKFFIYSFMIAALVLSTSAMAQDNDKKSGSCCKAKTESAEKKSEHKDKACCSKSKSDTAKAKSCCSKKEKGKSGCSKKKAKACTNKDAVAETKSCGKKG